MATKKKPKRRMPATHPRLIRARQREKRAIELREQGWSFQAIAAEVGYSDRCGAWEAVTRAMARLVPQEKADAIRNRQVAIVKQVQQEALEQWWRSVEDAKKTVVNIDSVPGENGAKEKKSVTQTTEGQTGNPALLDKIIKASERLAKFLGLDAPQKLELGGETSVRVIGLKAADVFQAAADRARGK